MARTSLAAWAEERLASIGHAWPGLPPRPDNVVVGVDGSPEAENAVVWGRLLGAHLHLVHGTVMTVPPVAPSGLVEPYRLVGEGIPTEERHEVFEPARAMARTTPTTSHLLADPPPDAVKRVAHAQRAGLVVVGHLGKSFLERKVLGSVSESVVHAAELSVLVSRGDPADGPVVAAVGEDPASATAAAWATAMAGWLDRRLILARSVPADAPRSSFPDEGPGAMSVDLPWPPKAAVRDLAHEEDASLIVAGHGRRPGWLGSNAIHLVRYGHTSVLIGRPW